MTDAGGTQEARPVAGLSDEDAKERPAGNRRPKPVIVEREEAADEPEAAVVAQDMQEGPASDDVAAAPDEATVAMGDQQEGNGQESASVEPTGSDPVVSEDQGIGTAETVGEIPEAAGLDPDDVRTDYLDPEFTTPKEISTMACNLGTQIYLSRWQKKQDTPIRAGVEDAAKMITFAFDHELIMETFDRATEAANANRNFLEISRRRLKAQMEVAAAQQGGEQ